MKRAGLAMAMAIAFASPLARAADNDACFSAPVEGQKLQKDGKLKAALERFETCAQRTCPPEIVADCSRWVDEVSSALPSIVVVARGDDGRDLPDARVSIDGAPPADIGTRAIPIDPGAHKLVFSSEGFDPVELPVTVHEGERHRVVAATFARATAPVQTQPKPVEMRTTTSRPVPAYAWVTLAIGAASLASFATVASFGVAERSSDGCATGCTQPQKDDVDLKFHVADVLLGVGIAGVALAAIFYFVRPTRTTAISATGLTVRFQ